MAKPVIWITGASSGIGEAAAKKFSNSGYAIILSARNEHDSAGLQTSFPILMKIRKPGVAAR